MKTLLFLFSLVSAHADLSADGDRPWMDAKGQKLRGATSSIEDREWMSDDRVKRLKKTAQDDREWMKGDNVRRLKLKQVKQEDREWMGDERIRRQAKEDRNWMDDGATKRGYTQTAEAAESPESAR